MLLLVLMRFGQRRWLGRSRLGHLGRRGAQLHAVEARRLGVLILRQRDRRQVSVGAGAAALPTHAWSPSTALLHRLGLTPP